MITAKKWTNERVDEYLKHNNISFQRIDDYKNGGTNLKFLCKKCNKEFERRWDVLISKAKKCPHCEGMIHTKWNDNMLCDYMLEKQYDFTKLDEYNGCDIQMNWLCHKCNTIFKRNWWYVTQGVCDCPNCKPSPTPNKHTDAYINEEIRMLDLKFSKVGTYVNNTKKLKLKCNICDKYFYRAWGVIVSGATDCPHCTGYRTHEIIKEQFYKKLEKDGYIFLTEYVNSTTKVLCIDSEFNFYKIHPTTYLKNISPSKWVGNTYAMFNFGLWMIENQPQQKLLNGQIWNTTHSKLKFICPIHGEYFQSPVNKMSQEYDCPKCGKILGHGVGEYNITRAERHKDEWLNISCVVYKIQCSNDYECFYKIGITTVGVKNRFRQSSTMPYKYVIIEEIHTNLYDAVYLEIQMHQLNKNNKYVPQIKFGGYTECFISINE